MQTGEELEGTRRAWHSLTEAHWLVAHHLYNSSFYTAMAE